MPRQSAGDAVLAENPDLLVIVGGLDFQTHLRSALLRPVRLALPSRLVYAVHDYLWLRFGHLLALNRRHVAPVYLSETGTCTAPNATEPCHRGDPRYWRLLLRYLERTDLDFAYWPLNSTQGVGYGRRPGAPETYGLLSPEWSGYGAEAVLADLRRLQRPRRGPWVAPATRSGREAEHPDVTSG